MASALSKRLAKVEQRIGVTAPALHVVIRYPGETDEHALGLAGIFPAPRDLVVLICKFCSERPRATA